MGISKKKPGIVVPVLGRRKQEDLFEFKDNLRTRKHQGSPLELVFSFQHYMDSGVLKEHLRVSHITGLAFSHDKHIKTPSFSGYHPSFPLPFVLRLFRGLLVTATFGLISPPLIAPDFLFTTPVSFSATS